MSQKTSTETSAATRKSNREFHREWDEENGSDAGKSFGNPDAVAAERARELRGEPLPEPKVPGNFAPTC